jgi:hypothetical protein
MILPIFVHPEACLTVRTRVVEHFHPAAFQHCSLSAVLPDLTMAFEFVAAHKAACRDLLVAVQVSLVAETHFAKLTVKWFVILK